MNVPPAVSAPSVSFAAPLDRLAAFVLDGLIVGIAVGLGTAPLQNQIRLEELVRRADHLQAWSVAAAAAGFFIYILYHGFCVARWGATFGQKFLGLRVGDAWTLAKPSITESFTRAVARPISIIFLIPLLGMFRDQQRRTLHDRIANTLVLCATKNAVGSPSASERRAARSLAGIVALALSAIVALGSYDVWQGSAESGESARETDPGACVAVPAGVESWGGALRPSRLTVALSLFGTGQIGAECLDKEATAVGNETPDSDFYYLAKAFAHADEPELSDGYLEEVCRVTEAASTTSEACALAEILSMINDGAHDQAWLALNEQLRRPRTSVVTQIWAIREAEHQMKFREELALIEKVEDNRTLADFLEVRESVALWGLGRQAEAKTLANGLLTHLEPAAAGEISQWFCQREIEDQCPATRSRSCKWFSAHYAQDDVAGQDVLAGLTYVRAQECNPARAPDYARLAQEIPHSGVKQYVHALQLHAQSQNIESKRLLLRLIQAPEAEIDLQQEAFAKLVDFVSTSRELKVLESRWKTAEHISWSWRSVGHHIFNRYRALHLRAEALRVGDALLTHEPNDQHLRGLMVLTAYQNRDYGHAWSYLTSTGSGPESRRPASLDPAGDDPALARAVSDLRERFGGP